MRRTCGVWMIAIAAMGMTSLSSVQADTRGTREGKGSGLGFRLASSTPVSGFDRVTVPTDNSTLYVAPRPIWTGGDVVSTQTRDGSGLEFTLSPEAAQRLTTVQGADQLAIYVDGKLTNVGRFATSAGRVTVLGLSSAQAERVVKLLSGVRPVPAPTPSNAAASINVVPIGMENGLFFVDVYVEGVTGLRTYQVALTVSGGSSGAMLRENVEVDTARDDYVFAGLDVVDAADQVGGRITSVLKDGAIDHTDPGYLGTYAFRPSSDAAGTFEIAVEIGSKTFLADATSEMIDFRTGPAATFTVGGGPIPGRNAEK